MSSTLARTVPLAEEFGGGLRRYRPAGQYSDKKPEQGFANESTHYRVHDARGPGPVDRRAHGEPQPEQRPHGEKSYLMESECNELAMRIVNVVWQSVLSEYRALRHQDSQQPESQPESVESQPESQPESVESQPESQPESVGSQPESQPESVGSQPESRPESVGSQPESRPESRPESQAQRPLADSESLRSPAMHSGTPPWLMAGSPTQKQCRGYPTSRMAQAPRSRCRTSVQDPPTARSISGSQREQESPARAIRTLGSMSGERNRGQGGD